MSLDSSILVNKQVYNGSAKKYLFKVQPIIVNKIVRKTNMFGDLYQASLNSLKYDFESSARKFL